MKNKTATTIVPFTVVNLFYRPEFRMPVTFFDDDPHNDQYFFSDIDPVINTCLKNLATSVSLLEDKGHHYTHYHTGSEKMNDEGIIKKLDQPMIIVPFRELAVTAAYLIIEDLKGKGPLASLYPEEAENLNLGVFTLEQKNFQAFIERKKPVLGQIREYHFHTGDAPRIFPYKPFRNMLIRDKNA